ncbi:nucleotide pyrophosphohydrolase [Pediococcus stilesii]|uniref:Nucleotide pyrophosphohydrolase n=1 Tax=Pediococcus stilesii TaxID=331679 RepID=A0A0R2KV88_9LACO|nr:nucleotide pyrophosphohydrolase [Pediococcus stilesii]KRN93491.1 hypothetical protein IV81_GL000492 [Pediococcus stilesii]TLQ02811.1 nucleotide pyrophosphohydrolase [Pediococcus stilesii]
MEYDEIEKMLIKFRDERDWKKYHNLKNLILSLNLEASESLEIFQWKNEQDELSNEEEEHLEEEIADVLIYAFYVCEKLGVNPYDLIQRKVKFNEGRTWKNDRKGNERSK